MKTSKIKKPYCSSFWYCLAKLYGSCDSRTFDPSRGGIGNKLNTPKIKLIVIVKRKIASTIGGNVTGKTFKI